MKTYRITRRDFVKKTSSAAALLSFPFVSSRSILGANETLNIGAIGAGGKGGVDVDGVSHENIVALCDVDQRNAAGTFAKFPKAKQYKDFREMLEKEGDRIDAVTVSIPDHMHAPAAIAAMKLGKHVYCQKPLTHTVFEARQMAKVAREQKVATQMGNQGHSNPESRRLVELIHSGVLGNVREAHVWTDRPGSVWPQGIPRPAGTHAVPQTLDWDLWLGVAPWRPYHPDYVPFKWRGFWDFGTGALGDMGCHNMDLAFFSLKLRDPLSVYAMTSEVTAESAPKWSVITYEFPALGDRAPVKLTWYDGGKKPSGELVKKTELPGNGVIMIGDKDTLYVPSYWGTGSFVSGAKVDDYNNIPQTLPRLPDFDKNHYQEWTNACKGGPKALSNFDYSGPMTEAVLLGNVAIRAGQRIEWDAEKLEVTNLPDANRYIRTEYRKGWAI
ncbi:MAG: Gfo/Idh/MocA family oxidoreductase [Verrucomicrobia bacterium]|nr:Gfo/Idh/MocA family oxidoreductase [Verrucomicrobiota bacterium]